MTRNGAIILTIGAIFAQFILITVTPFPLNQVFTLAFIPVYIKTLRYII